MKNPSGRGGRLWFWSGVILIVIGASIAIFGIGLLFGLLFSSGVILIVIGASVALVGKLGFRSGVILITLGAWMAIGMLPALFVSIVVFALIGGLGLLISYHLKRIRSTLSWGLGVAAWGYFFSATVSIFSLAYMRTTNYYTKTDITLLFGSLITVVPIAVLVTLVIAWLGRSKLSHDHKTLTAFKKVALFTLLIATPFIIAGLSDYNNRGDPNPPQVINLKIVDKWIDQHFSLSDMEYYDIFMVKGETLDGSCWFSFFVSTDFYNEHDIGSYCWIRVRSGALGYACISMLTYDD